MSVESWKRPADLQLHHIHPWVPACIVWVDLKGSKELIASGKNHEVDQAFEALKSVTTESLRPLPGKFVRHDGDAIVFIFENRDVEQAVEFGISVQREYVTRHKHAGWSIAVAITYGLVGRSHTDCDGPPVELAHSLAVAASPNAVLIDYATRMEILRTSLFRADRFAFARPREIVPRNFELPTIIFEVIWADHEFGLK